MIYETKRTIVFVGHKLRVKTVIKIKEDTFKISFDGFKKIEKNEDPFIWNSNFLYSFCHANDSLSEEIRKKIEEEDVYIVFVSPVDYKKHRNIFEIDTIIKAEDVFLWPERNSRCEDNLSKNVFNSNVKKFHLPDFQNGNLTEHNKKTVFTCIGSKEESFLPMVKEGGEFRPFQFSEDRSKDLISLLKVDNNKAYYVAKITSDRLSNKQEVFDRVAKEVYQLIDLNKKSNGKSVYNYKFLKGTEIEGLDKDKRRYN